MNHQLTKYELSFNGSFSLSASMVIPMSNTTASGLLSLNSAVTSTDTATTGLRTVNSIALNNIAIGQSSYNAGDLSKLRYIAKQCPYTYGTSVYEARAILAGIDWH